MGYAAAVAFVLFAIILSLSVIASRFQSVAAAMSAAARHTGPDVQPSAELRSPSP